MSPEGGSGRGGEREKDGGGRKERGMRTALLPAVIADSTLEREKGIRVSEGG